MPDEDKIKSALREIGYCDNLVVKISNGEVVAIPPQVVQRPFKNGVDTQHTIREAITK